MGNHVWLQAHGVCFEPGMTAAGPSGHSSRSGGSLQRKCACGRHGAAEGECEDCRRQRLPGILQRKTAQAQMAGGRLAPALVHEVLHSTGRPLDSATRAFMEPRFGQDFSGVRVHDDSRAAASARSIDAVAYTVGRDVVLGDSQSESADSSSRYLLAHELAHVVQQRGSSASDSLTIAPRQDAAEAVADATARDILSNQPVLALGASERRLQRLGGNPSCTTAQAGQIHQAIFDANSWVGKALKALAVSPLEPRTLGALTHNFGTAGTAANASTIAANLRAGRADMLANPYTCTNASNDTFCAAGNCGDTVFGGHASNICTNVTLASTDAVFRAGCVLHEAMHASDASMTGDEYSGWFGHSSSTPAYPGTAPLTNADSYTTLAMELS